MEIDCNGEGALFVVARTDDITIEEIKDVKPSPELRRQLVPRIEPSSVVTAVQVTFFKLAFSDPSGPITTQVFSISKDQVTSLKRRCSGASTFCAVSALLWRCVCAARRLPPDVEARLTISADIRRRVMPPLPKCYFGNALVRVGLAATVRDVTASEALASVAGRIGGTVGRIDDEMVRSAIDYFQAVETSGHWAATGTRPETELHVTSWLGMPIYDTDFGWGKPLVMSRAENLGGIAHLLSDGPTDGAGAGGISVLMSMEAANVKELDRLLYEALARCGS
ncbi:unnamed protein product [Urochloa humidicola]